MRHYFKKEPEHKSKLFRFGKKYNADYLEYEQLIWKIPKRCGDCRMAVALGDDGIVVFGTINPECDNFENCRNTTVFYPLELKWIGEMYEVIKNFKTFK